MKRLLLGALLIISTISMSKEIELQTGQQTVEPTYEMVKLPSNIHKFKVGITWSNYDVLQVLDKYCITFKHGTKLMCIPVSEITVVEIKDTSVSIRVKPGTHYNMDSWFTIKDKQDMADIIRYYEFRNRVISGMVGDK